MAGDITRGYEGRFQKARVSRTQLDRTSSTVLTDVPNCSATLFAGATYVIEAHITGTATANGGAKASIAGDGILSATAFTMMGTSSNGTTTNARTTTTTLGTAVGGATAAMTDYILLGSITVNVGGVLKLQFAQNASHSDTSSAYVGSYLKVTRAFG